LFTIEARKMLSSPVDIAIVAGVALLIFGPKKMPELGRALGQGIGNFKKALTETADELKTAANTDATKPVQSEKASPEQPSTSSKESQV
jgi:TatA/E family protein of Tat protein translocase